MKAAFLDRDGVINNDYGYIDSWERFKFCDGIEIQLRNLITQGFELFIITNQSGIARGYFTEIELFKIHNKMKYELSNKGIKIKDIFYCPHHSKGIVEKYSIECNCRKPKPGLIIQATENFMINLSESILIGDKITDIEAGISAGVSKNFLLNNIEDFSSNSFIKLKNLQDLNKYL
jgi:D-glycero-D-manno-heptose 1,7-bisphosphate phosphatase